MNYSTSVYVGKYSEFYNLFEPTPNGEYKLIDGEILSSYEKIIFQKIKEHL